MKNDFHVHQGRLVIVSNRLPEIGKDGEAQQGGLVSALRPAIVTCGKALWFGWSGRAASGPPRRAVEIREQGPLTTFALDLPAEDAAGYYERFSNGALWPLLHSFPERFRAEQLDYVSYRRVSFRFARTIARHLRPGDRIWVHDFHLFPLGAELRRRGFRGELGFFLHVPFPSPDIFALLPWAEDLLRELLAFDLVGFHTEDYVESYRRTLGRLVPEALSQRTGAYPIGIDPAPFEKWADETSGVRRGRELRAALQGRKLILGVDRLDYTKGIPERMRTFERFLERYPRWRQKVSYVQISAPSRTRVAEYVRQRREVEELVGRVNGKHGEPDWMPLRYIFRSYGQRELASLYRECDVGLVTPLRDGMNLVAKEFVAAQTGDPGVLVLSRFAGAADELREAVIVNPYDTEGCARALDRALSMPLAERARRQAALLSRIRAGTAERWARTFLEDLARAREERLDVAPLGVSER